MTKLIVKDGWVLSKNAERILKMVEKNEGYCPCDKNNGKCPCNNYLERDYCCCGLYKKV